MSRALPLPRLVAPASERAPVEPVEPSEPERTSDVTSLRFRFNWLSRQPGVLGYGVREPGDDWVVTGDVTAGWTAQAWFVSQLAESLQDRLGLRGFCRADLQGAGRRAIVTTTPDGVALVLAVAPDIEILHLLRHLGGGEP